MACRKELKQQDRGCYSYKSLLENLVPGWCLQTDFKRILFTIRMAHAHARARVCVCAVASVVSNSL